MRALAFSLLLMAATVATNLSAADAARGATLYKFPDCGCCEDHAAYLRENGFEVEVVGTADLPAVKRRHGVPERLAACHTVLVDGYVVEGHVPANVVNRLLAERPAILGVSLPGMPEGSPGMSGARTDPLVIYEIPAKATPTESDAIYAVE